MRRKVKSCLVYFILLMLVAFPKLVKEIEKFCSLNKSTFLVVFLLMGIAYGLCEIELLFRKKNKKMFYKIDQKKVVIFSMCLIGTLFVFGSSINNFFQNASLPAKVKIEVLSENNSARSNIWITNASINMIGKKDFIEIEENHFLSENGYPVLELEVTQIAESDILLICDNNSSDIKVTVDENKSKEYACKMIEENQKSISLLYNPGRSLCNLVVYLLAVLILSSLIYSIIYICVWGGVSRSYLKEKILRGLCKEISTPNSVLIFCVFWISFSIYGFKNYNVVKNFLETLSADTSWYWFTGDNLLLTESGFSLDKFILGTGRYAFRGYLIPVLFLIIKFITGSIFHLDPLLCCFVFLSFVASYLNCILLPEIYKLLHKKNDLKIWQILMINLFFWMFLRGHVLWPMADLIPFFCVMCALYFLLDFMEKESHRSILYSFAFIVGAVLGRSSYSVLFYLELIWVILWIKRKKYSFKSLLRLLLCIVIGILIISFPQIIINFMRDGSIEYLSGSMSGFSGNQSLVEYNIQFSLDNATQAWPYFLKNSLGNLMSSSIYPGMEELKLVDFIYIFISHPVEALGFFVSKLFMAIDIRTPLIYTDAPYITLGWRGIIMLFANAIVWSAFALSIMNNKRCGECYNRNEKIIGLIGIVFVTLPYLIMSIEWRYYIPLYYMAYYGVGFCTPRWLSNINGRDRAIFGILVLGLAGLFVVFSTNDYANFNWNNPGGIIF